MADEAHEQIVVGAPPERCWAVATDYERYPEWAKDVKHAAVLERDEQGRGSRVEYRVAGLGRSIRYVLAYDYADAPAAFSWELVEGDVLRRLDGRYGFEEADSGTRVTYDLLVDVAIPLPGMIKRRAAGMIVGTALKELKKEAEPMSEPLRDVSEDVAPEPEVERERTDEPEPERPTGPLTPSAIESLVGALLEAGPEVAEHVVRAAQELLLAAQCVVDAAGKAVREQQDARRDGDDSEDDADAESSAGAPLRHLDLAE
jgi:ribosome-associated toxin RatA of RatAB toxin-antitoxin module